MLSPPHFVITAIVEVREHYPPGLRLVNARHRRRNLLPDELACIFDHDHRTVVEERDALITFATDVTDHHTYLLARNDRRADCVGELVEAQNLYTLQLSHA